MTNEELLQQVLNSTVDRLGKQAVYYEAEVAKLNSQIIILNKQLEDLKSQQDTVKQKTTKTE
jgi:CII-binding regulator of phage lambda lysogenization HflD